MRGMSLKLPRGLGHGLDRGRWGESHISEILLQVIPMLGTAKVMPAGVEGTGRLRVNIYSLL